MQTKNSNVPTITEKEFKDTVATAKETLTKVEESANRISSIINSSTPSKNIRGTVRERRKSTVQDILIVSVICLAITLIGITAVFYSHGQSSNETMIDIQLRLAELEAKESVLTALRPLLQSSMPLP